MSSCPRVLSWRWCTRFGSQKTKFVYHDLDAAVLWGTRALKLATRLDDTEGVVCALEHIARGGVSGRQPTDGPRDKLEQALALAVEKWSARSTPAGRSILLVRCFAPGSAPPPHRVREYADAGLEYCVERGLETWRLYLARQAVPGWSSTLGHWERRDRVGWVGAARSTQRAPGRARVCVGRRSDWSERGAATPRDRSCSTAPAHTVVAATRAAGVDHAGRRRASRSGLADRRPCHRQRQVTDEGLALAPECREPWLDRRANLLAIADRGARIELPEARRRGSLIALSIAGEWGTSPRSSGQTSAVATKPRSRSPVADDETALRRAHNELQALGARPATAIAGGGSASEARGGATRAPRPGRLRMPRA